MGIIRDHGFEPGYVEKVGLGVGVALWLATTALYGVGEFLHAIGAIR